jgi:hypothetical protein
VATQELGIPNATYFPRNVLKASEARATIYLEPATVKWMRSKYNQTPSLTTGHWLSQKWSAGRNNSTSDGHLA